MTYFNTTGATGAALKLNVKKAETQNEKVLAFFKSRPGRTFSPSDIWRLVFKRECPITSVRRSITNLMNQGLLEKTSITKDGIYGRKEYCWRLKYRE